MVFKNCLEHILDHIIKPIAPQFSATSLWRSRYRVFLNCNTHFDIHGRRLIW